MPTIYLGVSFWVVFALDGCVALSSSVFEARWAYSVVPWWNGSSAWTVASSLECNGFFGSVDFRSSVESDRWRSRRGSVVLFGRERAMGISEGSVVLFGGEDDGVGRLCWLAVGGPCYLAE